MSISGSSKPASGRVPPKISGRRGALPPPEPKKVPLPAILPYPAVHPFADCEAHHKGHLCYIIRHYGTEGISVLILREPKQDKVTILCGDWHGRSLDLAPDNPDRLAQAALVFVQSDVGLFMEVMHRIKLLQAQFFLAIGPDGKLVLTDIQVSLNKLAGPGMVRDIFGKIYQTQEVIKVEPMDERALEYLQKGTGSYEGDLIIKPSKFTLFSPPDSDALVPLYSQVKRG